MLSLFLKSRFPPNYAVDNALSLFNIYLDKAVEAARLEAAEKSQATSFSNPMFNQVDIIIFMTTFIDVSENAH